MKILIACEESGIVTQEFRKLGHESYSCDILPTSGNHPEWHIKTDVLNILTPGDNGYGIKDFINFTTLDGVYHILDKKWDMIIAFPPCTYMSKAGARWMFKDGKLNEDRYQLALEAKELFMMFYNDDCPRIAIENPFPLKIVELPKETQIIQPYQFGDPFSKKTLLWLKGLPQLKPTNILTEYRTFMPSNTGEKKRGQHSLAGIPKNQRQASKTFPGIAKAMAEQWGGDII